METNSYTVFEGDRIFTQGSLEEVILKVKTRMGSAGNRESILIFSDATGKTMDFNFHGSEEDVLRRLEVFAAAPIAKGSPAGPGRPKIGVSSREVSLLPRHWEWLANQDQGASAVLRGLVEGAMKKNSGAIDLKRAQERTYKFMHVMAGDRPNYEEALRALYRQDQKTFNASMTVWPEHIRLHARKLARPIFAKA